MDFVIRHADPSDAEQLTRLADAVMSVENYKFEVAPCELKSRRETSLPSTDDGDVESLSDHLADPFIGRSD